MPWRVKVTEAAINKAAEELSFASLKTKQFEAIVSLNYVWKEYFYLLANWLWKTCNICNSIMCIRPSFRYANAIM